jgi:hypothetical protein
MIFQSVTGVERLELSHAAGGPEPGPVGSFEARLVLDGLRAECRIDVNVIGPADLIDLLDDLAADADGWTGERAWGSPEGRLSLAFSRDRLGHVRMSVEVREEPYPDGWVARGVLILEPGSLQWIAHAARRFLRVA